MTASFIVEIFTGYKQDARINRLRTLVLQDHDVARFDHAEALCKLNSNVDATNAALKKSSRFLNSAKVRQLAEQASRNGGLCVVSFCDGKGTLLGILLRAGVNVRRYLSVDTDENAQRVCRSNYGGSHEHLGRDALRFFGDARKLTVHDLKARDCWPVDLLMGGTPCNDISGCNGAAEGTHGEHSSLLYDFDALARKLSKANGKDNGGFQPCMLFENVVPNTLEAQNEVKRVFGLPVLASEGAVVCIW